MNKIENLKWILLTSTILMLPLLLLCFYAHPASDDFPISHTARDWGSYTTVVGYYKCWSARYTSMFLMSVNPIVFHSFGTYKLVPLLLMAGLFFSVRYFFSVLSGQPSVANRMAMIFIPVFLYAIPDLPGGLYFLGGSLFYQPGNMLLVSLSAFLIQFPPPSKMMGLRLTDWLRGFLQGTLLFLLAGCNEIGMLLALAIPTIGFTANLMMKKEVSAGWMLLFLAAAAANLIILLSPATFYRMEASGGLERNWVEMVQTSLMAMADCVLNWLSFPALLILLISVYLYSSSGKKQFDFSKMESVYFSLLSFLLLFASFLPSFIGEGKLKGHTENSLLFLFMVLACGNIFLWGNRLHDVPFIQKTRHYLSYAPLAILPLSPGFRQAVQDLYHSEAAAYSAECEARYQLMSNTPGDTVRVPSLKHKPKSLFAGDIGDYPDPWYDNHFAALFGKKWVELDEASKAAKKKIR
jgi:hypothetical protein